MIPTTASTTMVARTVWFIAAVGKSGTAKRKNPKVPSLSMMLASTTDPAVGASTWASGSQVWNGNIGTLTANAKKNARNSKMANVEPYAGSWKMSGAVLYKA